MNIYAQHILNHYRHPRNSGRLSDPSITHQEANYSCGDIVTVDLKIEKNRLSDIRFRAEGCAISQAAISILSDFMKGKTFKKISSLTKKDIIKLLGIEISFRREKCALLGLLAIQNAILLWQKKPLKKFSDTVM